MKTKSDIHNRNMLLAQKFGVDLNAEAEKAKAEAAANRPKTDGEWIYEMAIDLQTMGMPLSFDATLATLHNAWTWGLTHPNKEETFTLKRKKFVAPIHQKKFSDIVQNRELIKWNKLLGSE